MGHDSRIREQEPPHGPRLHRRRAVPAHLARRPHRTTGRGRPDAWLATVPPEPSDPSGYEPNHIKRWLAYRLATTSPGNAHNNYRALHVWFQWLLDEDEIDTHPMARMKPPHVPSQPPPVTPVEFMKKVLKGCAGKDFNSRRDEAIIRLIWDTGGRLSEIANIDMERDLDLQRRVVNVLGKRGKWRALPFSPATGKALGRYLRVRWRERRRSHALERLHHTTDGAPVRRRRGNRAGT